MKFQSLFSFNQDADRTIRTE